VRSGREALCRGRFDYRSSNHQVYFAPTSPKGKEANWIPTGEDFFLMFRLYGPGEAAFDKTWQLDEVERLD
jgi:hypothetical protein